MACGRHPKSYNNRPEQSLSNHHNYFSTMSFPVRFYYDPFSAFDRLFDDAFVARCHPSSAVVERGQDTGNEHQLLLRPKYVLSSR